MDIRIPRSFIVDKKNELNVPGLITSPRQTVSLTSWINEQITTGSIVTGNQSGSSEGLLVRGYFNLGNTRISNIGIGSYNFVNNNPTTFSLSSAQKGVTAISVLNYSIVNDSDSDINVILVRVSANDSEQTIKTSLISANQSATINHIDNAVELFNNKNVRYYIANSSTGEVYDTCEFTSISTSRLGISNGTINNGDPFSVTDLQVGWYNMPEEIIPFNVTVTNNVGEPSEVISINSISGSVGLPDYSTAAANSPIVLTITNFTVLESNTSITYFGGGFTTSFFN